MCYCISFSFSFPLPPHISACGHRGRIRRHVLLKTRKGRERTDPASSDPQAGLCSAARRATWPLWLLEGRRCFPLVSRGLGWAVQSRGHQGPGLLPAAVPLSWLNVRHGVCAPGKRTGSYWCADERQRPVELVSWTLHPVIFVSICNQPAPIPMATSSHKDISEKGGFLTESYCPK